MKTKTPFKEAVEKAGWKPYIYIDEKDFPEKQEGTLAIFTLDKYVSASELDKEYASRGLVPAEPLSVLEFNSLEKYVATQWRDTNDNYCYATFLRWLDERRVDVDRLGRDWDGDWWFVGVRKLGLGTGSARSSSVPSSLAEQVALLEKKTVELPDFIMVGEVKYVRDK